MNQHPAGLLLLQQSRLPIRMNRTSGAAPRWMKRIEATFVRSVIRLLSDV